MIPRIFLSGATSFATEGRGRLSGCSSCIVTRELRGEYELRMTLPAVSPHFEDIGVRSIIVAPPSPYDAPQPFRVYRIRKRIDGSTEVDAAHLSYDLAKATVRPFTAAGPAAAMAALINSVPATGFTFECAADFTAAGTFSIDRPQTVKDALSQIADFYGGEIDWDGWTVTLRPRIGETTSVIVEYGKNLTDMMQLSNVEDTVTGIVPYWQRGDQIVIADVVRVPGAWPYDLIEPEDVSSYIPDGTPLPPMTAQVSQAAQAALADRTALPETSIDVDFVPLGQTLDYQHIAVLEKCQIGDLITVRHPLLGVDEIERITKTTYDALRDQYTGVVVGTPQKSLTHTLAGRI